jgi:CubicO group peptidase (beta-lactamase class C family)
VSLANRAYYCSVQGQSPISRSLGVIFVVLIVMSQTQVTMGPQASGGHLSAENSDIEINRIIDGLLPAAVIQGQSLPRMRLTDRMKHYHVPGVSIAVFDKGRILWARGFGLADIPGNKPVTPETLFQAASVSKSVTAFAALRLVQQGKLALDEDVNRKLVSWKVPENEFTKNKKVTLRRLLSHTAGMNVTSVGGYFTDEPLPTTVQILDGQKPAKNEPVRVDGVPGKEFRYSGGGYVVVQLLLMEVTHKSFPELMNDLVFRPLGMTHSTFEVPLRNGLWSTAAKPYANNGTLAESGWPFGYPAMAPAGLWTTPSDLAQFAMAVQKAYLGRSNLLSSALAHEMLAYQSEEIYGLGVALAQRDHPKRFWHSGANGDYKCLFDAFAETGQGLVSMTNGHGGLGLILELERAVAQEYSWPDGRPQEHAVIKLSPTALRTFTGEYIFSGLFKFKVTEKSGKLYVQYPVFGDEPIELHPESETRFFATEAPFLIEFQKEADGSVKKAKAWNGPESLNGEKVADTHE